MFSMLQLNLGDICKQISCHTVQECCWHTRCDLLEGNNEAKTIVWVDRSVFFYNLHYFKICCSSTATQEWYNLLNILIIFSIIYLTYV